MYKVELRKEKGWPIGLKVSSEEEVTKTGAFTVIEVLPNSIAKKQSHIQPGDQIVDVSQPLPHPS